MVKEALREIPPDLYDQYTLNGTIRVDYYYVNDVCSNDKPGVYTEDQINAYLKKIAKKELFYYRETDGFLYEALEKYNIHGMKVGIMGSANPLYESICIYNGGNPVTVDYHEIMSQDKRLETMSLGTFRNNLITFDAAFSISSFEHDGLGRYGDPLNPNADIEAMKYMKTKMKRNGLLFLAVPVGEDTLVWNAHRIYGKTRLPLLLEGWKALDSFGFSEELFERKWDSKILWVIQPVFVLENI
jgi:hypothetical protein